MSLKVADSSAHSRNATLNDTPRKILVTLSSIKALPREEAEALLRALGFKDGDIDAYNKKYGVDLKAKLTTEFSSKPPRPTKDSSPKPGFQTYIGVSDHNYKVMTDFLVERRGAAKQSLPIKPIQTAESKQVYDNSRLQALKLRQLADQAQVETTSFGIPNKLTDKTHIVATLPRNAAATADNALSAYIEKRYGGGNLFGQDKLDILNAAKASGVKVENLKVSQNNSRVVEFDLNLESTLKLQKAYLDVQGKVNSDIAVADKVKQESALNQFLLGLIEGAKDDITGNIHAITHPLETLQGIRDAIGILSKLTPEDIKNIAAELGNKAANATPGEAAHAAGYVVGTVVVEAVLAKGAGAALSALGKTKAGAEFLARIGKLAEKTGEAVSLGKVKLAEMFSDEAAALASQRVKKALATQMYSGIPADVLANMAIVAGNKLKNGAVKFAEFQKQMIAELGEKVRPHLEKLYREKMTELGLTNKIDEVGIATSKPPLEGKVNYQIHDPNKTGRTIVDIDRFEGKILWEEKSATSGINKITGADETARWVSKHITKKFEDLVEAREHLPSFYKDAEIGFDFVKSGADQNFKAAVEAEIQRLSKLHPDVKIHVNWR